MYKIWPAGLQRRTYRCSFRSRTKPAEMARKVHNYLNPEKRMPGSLLGSVSCAVFWPALHLGLSHLYFVQWVKSCTLVSLHMPAASTPHRAMLLTGCFAPTLQLQLQLCLGAALCPLRLAFWATMALLTSLLLAICPWDPGHPGGWPSPLTPPPCSGCDPAAVHWPSCFWQLSAPCTTTTTTFRPTTWQQG